MLLTIIPKLPMRDKAASKQFYIQGLGFSEMGDYGDYLLLKKEAIELHLFEFSGLNPSKPESSQSPTFLKNLSSSMSHIILSCIFPSHVWERYKILLFKSLTIRFLIVWFFFATIKVFLNIRITWSKYRTFCSINKNILSFNQ
ncbi:MAG: hypothetical protein RIR57_1469 [Bacteroidota bacterium]